MKYYSREVTSRQPINRFGKLGYVMMIEYVKTNHIDDFNKFKRIPFAESASAKKYLIHKEADKVYEEREDD